MEKEKLIKDYEIACNVYLEAFCNKHGYVFEGVDMWVGNDVGTVACCGDGYFDMATIRTDIDEEAPEDELLKWYDYNMDAADCGVPQPNFHAWIHGCPRSSKEFFERVRAMRKELENIGEEEKKRLGYGK